MKFTGWLLLSVLAPLTIASAEKTENGTDRSHFLRNGRRVLLRSEERQNANANIAVGNAANNPTGGVDKKPFEPEISISSNHGNTAIAQGDCTIQVAILMQIPDAERLAEEEIFECEMDPQDVKGKAGLMRKLALSSEQKTMMKKMWLEGNLTPGKSKLRLQGMNVNFDTQEVKLPPGLLMQEAIARPGNGNGNNGNGNNGNGNTGNGFGSLNKGTDNSADTPNKGTANSDDVSVSSNPDGPIRTRNLQNGGVTGTKPILVVKVYANGLAREESPEEISDDIFGTGIDHDDKVNAASQLYACSMGKLTVVPGNISSSKKSAEGVIEVEIGISLNNGRGTIRNAVTDKVEDYLGFSLPGPYEQVMYVLEGCYQECGWAAYAYVNSWLSVYQKQFYKYPAIQIHELGHNFGFAHSGGLDGATYTDHTCLMGNPLYSDEVGKMCFNPAKNWQIGWYSSRRITVSPLQEEDDWAENYVMVGVADYENVDTNNLPVVMKLETGGSQDYFVGFNRATGMNSQNDEADDEEAFVDEVTIIWVEGGSGNTYALSYLQATLKEGQDYTIDKFGNRSGLNIVVQLLKIEYSDTSPWKAHIRVGTDEAPPAPATPEPTLGPSISLIPSISQAPSQEPSISLEPSVSNIPTASPIIPLTYAGNNGSPTPAFPLGECQGDCDDNSECAGDLVCFQRVAQESVPGCSGGGDSGSDYCCDRSKFQTELWIRGDGLGANSYGLCEGDCDSDSDCKGNLQCFQRSSSSPVPVPGCIGEDDSGNDYCYGDNSPTSSPTNSPSSTPTTAEPTTTPTKQQTSSPTTNPTMKPTLSPTNQPTGSPTGAPTKNPTASPSLPQPTSSPTKKPTGAPTTSPRKNPTDLPTKEPTSSPSTSPTTTTPTTNPSRNPTDSPTKKPTLTPTKSPSAVPTKSPSSVMPLVDVGNNGSPSPAFPLSACSGDCDDDSECLGDLKCFQRDDQEPVPGCLGDGSSQWDYCYDRSKFPTQIHRKENNLGRDEYGLCEGDCDEDTDCQGDLKCYQRNGNDPVPGCVGEDDSGNDYCAV